MRKRYDVKNKLETVKTVSSHATKKCVASEKFKPSISLRKSANGIIRHTNDGKTESESGLAILKKKQEILNVRTVFKIVSLSPSQVVSL